MINNINNGIELCLCSNFYHIEALQRNITSVRKTIGKHYTG